MATNDTVVAATSVAVVVANAPVATVATSPAGAADAAGSAGAAGAAGPTGLVLQLRIRLLLFML